VGLLRLKTRPFVVPSGLETRRFCGAITAEGVAFCGAIKAEDAAFVVPSGLKIQPFAAR